jgi:thymidylate synthase (FAD)
MNVELLWITPDSERIIELSGRTAYKSEDKISADSATRFIKGLIKRGHESVLEHATASFKITDVSRALTHQLVRHRLASYTQMSQRYVKQDGFEYVVPDSIANNENALSDYNNLMEYIAKIYQCMTEEENIPREDARFILPNACVTEIVMTCNFREWRHFLKVRCDKHAQWEIRELAYCIGKILYFSASSVFEDIMEGIEVD